MRAPRAARHTNSLRCVAPPRDRPASSTDAVRAASPLLAAPLLPRRPCAAGVHCQPGLCKPLVAAGWRCARTMAPPRGACAPPVYVRTPRGAQSITLTALATRHGTQAAKAPRNAPVDRSIEIAARPDRLLEVGVRRRVLCVRGSNGPVPGAGEAAASCVGPARLIRVESALYVGQWAFHGRILRPESPPGPQRSRALPIGGHFWIGSLVPRAARDTPRMAGPDCGIALRPVVWGFGHPTRSARPEARWAR